MAAIGAEVVSFPFSSGRRWGVTMEEAAIWLHLHGGRRAR
jgi:hypothetical protein